MTRQTKARGREPHARLNSDLERRGKERQERAEEADRTGAKGTGRAYTQENQAEMWKKRIYIRFVRCREVSGQQATDRGRALTLRCCVLSTEGQQPGECLDTLLVFVDEDGGEVRIWVLWYALGGDDFPELCLGVFLRQHL